MSQAAAMAAWVGGYGAPIAIADAVLKTVVGTYGTIRQFELYERQTGLMERGVTQAQDYLTLARRTYDEVATPTQDRLRRLFDRFLADFAGYESPYVLESQRLKTYVPAYELQEGRALAAVRARFDRAARARQRQVGRYSAGRVADDALQFAIAAALAQTDAANAAYRYEDAKKISLEEWYWSRQSDGLRYVGNMQGNAISALNGAAAGMSGALNAIGNGVGRVGQALAGVGAAVGNNAQANAALANGAFRSIGYEQSGFDRMMGGLRPSGGPGGPGNASPNADAGAGSFLSLNRLMAPNDAQGIQTMGANALTPSDYIGASAFGPIFLTPP